MSKSARGRDSSRAINIEDLRSLARRRLPKVVFDYVDGGAESEVTLRDNLRAYEELTFCPCHAVAIPHCDLRTYVLGIELSMPVLLAPVGYCRVMQKWQRRAPRERQARLIFFQRFQDTVWKM